MLAYLGSAVEDDPVFNLHEVQSTAVYGVLEGTDRERGKPGEASTMEFGEGAQEGHHRTRQPGDFILFC